MARVLAGLVVLLFGLFGAAVVWLVIAQATGGMHGGYEALVPGLQLLLAAPLLTLGYAFVVWSRSTTAVITAGLVIAGLLSVIQLILFSPHFTSLDVFGTMLLRLLLPMFAMDLVCGLVVWVYARSEERQQH